MEAYLPLWGFIVLMVSTPGPANMVLMASGAAHGLARSVPFIAGVTLGKLAMNVAISLGFGAFLLDHPAVSGALAWASAGLFAFLVLRGWTPREGEKAGGCGFALGLAVHPLNPKAWTMTTLAYTQFSAGFGTGFERYALVPLSFLAVQVVFHTIWCLAGALMRKHLSGNLALHRGLIVLTLAVIAWALLR